MTVTRRDFGRLAGAGLAASGLTAVPGATARAGTGPIAIGMSTDLPGWMETIAWELADDCRRTWGNAPAVRPGDKAAPIQLLLAASAPAEWRAAAAGLVPGSETFRIVSGTGGQVAIIGGSPEGLRLGIYRFSRDVLKLDPTWRWTGFTGPLAAPLPLTGLDIRGDTPTFRYRGWFINDEDLLTEWIPGTGKRNVDYPYYGDVAAVDAVDRICETAARLGMNFMIPASLLNILNPPEEHLLEVAARRGLKVTQHHIEPVGISGFTFAGYWKTQGEQPRFSFYSEREKMLTLWQEGVKRWSRYDTIWALGLRGTGDRPMWMADSSIPRDDRIVGKLISEAIAIQRDMILKANPGRKPEMTTVLWAEGSTLLAGGHLTIPEDVTIIFSDNSPGAQMQADFDQPRDPKRRYGVYYHHQLWSSGPHLVQSVPPAVSRQVLGRAVTTGATDYALFNCSNVREFVIGLTLSSDQISGYDKSGDKALQRLCTRWYGDGALVAEKLYDRFFAAYERQPETRQMFLDGQLKKMGRNLIAEIQRGDTPADATDKPAAAETSAWAARAFPQLTLANPTEAPVRAALKRQIASLEGVIRDAKLALPSLPEKARPLFDANLVVQAEILIGLLRWVDALVDARAATDPAVAKRRIEDAAAALEAGVTAGKRAASGHWTHWYRGDRKMNVPGLIEETRKLAAGRAAANG